MLPAPIVMVDVSVMPLAICGSYTFNVVSEEPKANVIELPVAALIAPLCSKSKLTLEMPLPIYTSEVPSPKSTSPTALVIVRSSPLLPILPVSVPEAFTNCTASGVTFPKNLIFPISYSLAAPILTLVFVNPSLTACVLMY